MSAYQDRLQALREQLKAENAYFEAAMKPHAKLVSTLFEEMKGRQKEDESSVPLRDGDYLYWWAFKPGAQYRTWYRKPVKGAGADQVIFDEAVEPVGLELFAKRLQAVLVSGHKRLSLPTARSRAVMLLQFSPPGGI